MSNPHNPTGVVHTRQELEAVAGEGRDGFQFLAGVDDTGRIVRVAHQERGAAALTSCPHEGVLQGGQVDAQVGTEARLDDLAGVVGDERVEGRVHRGTHDDRVPGRSPAGALRRCRASHRGRSPCARRAARPTSTARPRTQRGPRRRRSRTDIRCHRGRSPCAGPRRWAEPSAHPSPPPRAEAHPRVGTPLHAGAPPQLLQGQLDERCVRSASDAQEDSSGASLLAASVIARSNSRLAGSGGMSGGDGPQSHQCPVAALRPGTSCPWPAPGDVSCGRAAGRGAGGGCAASRWRRVASDRWGCPAGSPACSARRVRVPTAAAGVRRAARRPGRARPGRAPPTGARPRRRAVRPRVVSSQQLCERENWAANAEVRRSGGAAGDQPPGRSAHHRAGGAERRPGGAQRGPAPTAAVGPGDDTERDGGGGEQQRPAQHHRAVRDPVEHPGQKQRDNRRPPLERQGGRGLALQPSWSRSIHPFERRPRRPRRPPPDRGRAAARAG